MTSIAKLRLTTSVSKLYMQKAQTNLLKHKFYAKIHMLDTKTKNHASQQSSTQQPSKP